MGKTLQMCAAALAVTVGLSGCMKPRTADVDVVGGTFSVMEITGPNATVLQHDSWGFPMVKQFSYKICLQDAVTKSSIKGQSFYVNVGESQVPGAQVTDQGGCMVVVDPLRIGFNILAQENFLSRTIHITAAGPGQRGDAKRVVAINPWAQSFGSGQKDVTDLKYNPALIEFAVPEAKISEALSGSLTGKDGALHRAKLEVRQLSYRTNQSSYSEENQILQTSVAFKPVLVPTAYDGRPLAPLKIAQGTLEVGLEVKSVPRNETDEPTLLAVFFGDNKAEALTNNNVIGMVATDASDVPEASRSYLVRGRIVDGEVQVQGFMDFRNRVPEGQVQAILSVSPNIELGASSAEVMELAPTGLQGFVGVFAIDSFQRAATNVSGVALFEDISHKYTIDASGDQVPLPGIVPPDGIEQIFPFQFSQMEVRFLMYAGGETATKRSVYFKVRTRVYNPLTNSPVPNEKFKVIPLRTTGFTDDVNDIEGALSDPALDFEGTVISTDREGWLEWTDRISHQYYRKEQYFVRTVEVSHPSSDYRGKLELIINPWDFTWTFGFDSRLQTGQFVKRLIQLEESGAVVPREPSVFYEPDYRWEAIGFRYSIDRFLTLSIKKRMQLSLYPKALRYNSLTLGRNAIQPVRDGVYLMKLALRNNYFVDYFADEPIEERSTEYISVVKKLVGVQNGKIVAPVEFGVRDYRLMRLRSQFFVELAAVDLDKINPATKERYIPQVDRDYIKAVMLGTRERPYEMGAEDRLDEKLRGLVGDLDTLIDEEAGIAPRTFVAPLVPLSNVFASTMRAVDTMEETYCRFSPCNEIQSDVEVPAEYERAADLDRSKLYQDPTDVAVAGTTVTDLINRWYVLEEQYRREMEDRSKMVNYLRENNLEFVQVQDPSTIREKITEDEIDLVNQVYRDRPVEDFLEDFNRPVPLTYGFPQGEGNIPLPVQMLPEVNAPEFVEFITNQTATDHLLRRMCSFFFIDVFGEQDIFESAKKQVAHTNMIQRMVSECIARMHRNDPDKTVFSFDRKLKIYQTSSFEEMGGVSINLNTSTNLSLNRGESNAYSKAWTVSVGVTGSLKFGDRLKDMMKAIPIIGAFIVPEATFNVSGNRSWSWSDSQFSNVSQGMSYADGLLMVSQQKYINIAFSRFERCTILRMTPGFVEDVGLIDYLENIHARSRLFTVQQGYAAVTRGVMICSGDIEEDETWFRESYYYFTQHFVEGDLLDSADPKNLPWLLTLRGLNDYRKFIANFTDLSTHEERVQTPLGNPNGMITPRDVPTEFGMGERPIKALEEAYRATNLSSPGFYTVTEDSLNINKMF